MILSNNKKQIINAKPRKTQRTFLFKPERLLQNDGMRCSITSFNSEISLKNSEVPFLKTTSICN